MIMDEVRRFYLLQSTHINLVASYSVRFGWRRLILVSAQLYMTSFPIVNHPSLIWSLVVVDDLDGSVSC